MNQIGERCNLLLEVIPIFNIVTGDIILQIKNHTDTVVYGRDQMNSIYIIFIKAAGPEYYLTCASQKPLKNIN